MGQKVNPLGFRLGVSQKHISHWFVENSRYSQWVVEDQFIRNFFYKRFPGIASINIKRDLDRIVIEIFSSNTRDLSIEGANVSTQVSPALSQKATSVQAAEHRVEASPSPVSSKSVRSGNHQIDSLCGQLLKELTIYRSGRFEKDMFKNKRWVESRAMHKQSLFKDTVKTQTSESNKATSPSLTEWGNQTVSGETKKPVDIELFLTKVEDPNRSAACLAEFIVEQLEKRVPFRRVLKRSIQKAEESSVEGIKVQISGRLNGAEIARSERIHKGQVPLHTLRAKIEYDSRTAKTIYGLLGVKVWVFNGFADLNELKLLNKN